MSQRPTRRVLGRVGILMAALMSAPAVIVVPVVAAEPASSAQQAACDVRVNNTHAKLLECVTLVGVREHQAALQAIADETHRDPDLRHPRVRRLGRLRG